MNPVDKFNNRAEKINSLLCVGLDTVADDQFEFNKKIIEQTHEFAAAYKPNAAFYEARGSKGLDELKKTMDYLHENHPDIFTIYDAKRADIGNSNRGYVEGIFDWLGFDAVTLHPYLGKEALEPFLEREDKVSIILCRTSNSGAGEFQDLISPPPHPPPSRGGKEKEKFLPLEGGGEVGVKPLWQVVAEKVATDWNVNNNCMLVVGATYPEETKKIREIASDMTFLVPGIGAQGGDLKAVMEAGLNSEGLGLMINSS